MGSYKNKRNYGQISLSSHTGGSEAIQYIRFLNAIISNNTFKVTICDLKNKDRNMADNIGASIKDLGKKWFGFSKMEILTPNELVERINRE